MRQYTPVITLALLVALALAVVSGGLLPSDSAVLADHINAPDNTAPAFATGGGSRSIDENSPAGVNIEGPISATDADGDVLTYSLGGTDEASFDIDASTGQLITKADLDEETKDSYVVTVTVDDGREGTADQTVVIMVDDVAEEPAQPSPPILTTGSAAESLEINWFPPENTGENINDYDYRHKKTTDTTWTVVEDGTSTDTSATLSSLEADTAYQVSVRAGSPEGDGPWSFASVGSTNKEGNAAPEFPSTPAARAVFENTPAGQRVGATVTATDANSTTLNYSLAGAHASLFEIERSTGQIKTKESLNTEAECRAVDSNHLTTCTYMVLVVVDDDGDGGSDVIAVIITVTDVSERPSQPAAPTVEAVEDDEETTDVDESTTSLKVSWVAPETTGPPITNYDLEYRKGTSGAFTDGPQAETGTSVTIDSLDPNSPYQIRVTANSAEQDSLPSLPGTGSTRPSNNPPVFSTDTIERTVNENTPPNTNIGRPITASDSDRGDTLTYSLVDPTPNTDGDHEEFFDIDEGSGQLKTKADLNHEDSATCGYVATTGPTECNYEVTVTATDKKGATDTIEVTIKVVDRDEAPSAPSKPTVTVDRDNPTDTLDVSWAEPANEGKPPISEYQVQYRRSGSWNDVSGVGTDLETPIENLIPFTTYTVQVRAVNDEGNSPWVSSRELTSKEGNNLPEFSSDSFARSVAESATRGNPVGDPVTATDDDDDDLTYSLGGAHASVFNIDSDSGQINVKDPLNHEAECGDDSNHEIQCSYMVDVKVVDGNGGSHSASVTITVTDDESEAPSPPSAPTVRPAEPTDDESDLDPTTMLLVTWPEPGNEGPAITQYEVHYKVSGGNFQTDNIVFETGDDANKNAAIITMLEDDTSYQVQVRATNGEGAGSPPWTSWSPVGTGSTRFANTRPKFPRSTYTLNVKENTEPGQSIGRPVEANDADGHRLTYSLEGVHEDDFTIVSGSGHIRTDGSLDYESRDGYSLTVRATDTHRGSAVASVTINVLDEQESPATPARPTVSAVAGSTDSVRVTWVAPANDGRPPIVDYDVKYRTGSEAFIPWTHESTDTSTIITGLSAGTRYEVQVKAWNMEDDSEWSPSGRGSPNPDVANRVPAFSGGARTLNIVENTPPNTDVGTPIAAIDRDGDTLTYTLEGTDADSFDILSTSDGGQIRTSAELNFEEKSSYSATVRVTDGRGGTDAVGVTIMVTDVDGEAPATPLTPTVTAISSTSLDVSWDEPVNTGPSITDYDVQYRAGSSGGFRDWPHAGTVTTATIMGLTAGTSYEVQVRATNDEGIGPWSESGTGSTSINNPPTFSSVTTSRSVAENTAAGENIGSPVAATDDDPDDTLTYTLSGLDASSFSINDETGQLMTGTPLDLRGQAQLQRHGHGVGRYGQR